jgi:hypothetical protein
MVRWFGRKKLGLFDELCKRTPNSKSGEHATEALISLDCGESHYIDDISEMVLIYNGKIEEKDLCGIECRVFENVVHIMWRAEIGYFGHKKNVPYVIIKRQED